MANPTEKQNIPPSLESQEPETEQSPKSGDSGGLTSPEGILMLSVAVILDAIGLALFCFGTWFGIDDYGILDILGMLIIGGWMLLRSGGLNSEIIKKGLKRFGIASLVELVPFLGGIAPSWTILVWKELK